VPEGLVEIVQRAMARSRRDRFATAAEFRDALVTFLRAYAPGYRRTRLANMMRQLWAREIDEEIATLLEYAMSEEPEFEAENLLEIASVDESIEAASESLEPPGAQPRVPRPRQPAPLPPPAVPSGTAARSSPSGVSPAIDEFDEITVPERKRRT
jgi:hypothetical protein